MRRLNNTNKKHLKRLLKILTNSLVQCQLNRHERFPLKPTGVWYAIGNDWLDWCRDEMPHWIGRYQHTLQIDESKILIIKTVDELRNFVNQYKYTPFPAAPNVWFIDWRAVAVAWSGIEIQNYHDLKWKQRANEFGTWFYALDVSGGWIWNINALIEYKWQVTGKRYRAVRIKPKVANAKHKQWMRTFKRSRK
jgi:hypothetical protein